MGCAWPQLTTMQRQSLRLIGGRSPGSQDSRRPRSLPALDDSQLRVIEGSSRTSPHKQRTSTTQQKLHLWNFNGFYHRFHSHRICLCATTGMLTTVKKLQLRHIHGFQHPRQRRARPTSPKNCTGEVFTVPCSVWHCAYLWHNKNIPHPDDELNLRHFQVLEQLGLCTSNVTHRRLHVHDVLRDLWNSRGAPPHWVSCVRTIYTRPATWHHAMSPAPVPRVMKTDSSTGTFTTCSAISVAARAARRGRGGQEIFGTSIM